MYLRVSVSLSVCGVCVCVVCVVCVWCVCVVCVCGVCGVCVVCVFVFRANEDTLATLPSLFRTLCVL